MKKFLPLLAAVTMLTGCGSATTNANRGNADESLEGNADYYQRVADDSSNAAVAEAWNADSGIDENAAEAAGNAQ